MIKTFRGVLADDGQDRIRLQTIRGKVGYKIIKLQVMPNNLNSNQEACVKIFKEKQTTVTFAFDFSDTNLLAAAYYTNSSAADTYSEDLNVIFDNEVFNQDIYITQKNNSAGVGINYYFELEVIRLTDSDAEFTTLKDIRGRNTNPVKPAP